MTFGVRTLAALGLSLATALAVFIGTAFAATVVVSPANMNGWAFHGNNTGIGSFVSGPLTAPTGSGSVKLFSGSQGNSFAAIYRADFQGSNPVSITKLDFWTFTQTSSVG